MVEQDVVQLEGEVDDQTGDVEEGALVHVSDSAARDQSVGVCNTRAQIVIIFVKSRGQYRGYCSNNIIPSILVKLSNKEKSCHHMAET